MDIKELIKKFDEGENFSGEIIIRSEIKEIEIRNVLEFTNLALANGISKVEENDERGYSLCYFVIDGWKIMTPNRY